MRNILVIKSSAAGDASLSNMLVDHARTRLADGQEVVVTERNLDSDPIAYLVSHTVAGVGRPGIETADAARVRALSDALIQEVDTADIILIGAPMYNYTMPATLKTWFDHVIRAGVTFNFTPTGPVGLLDQKPFVIVQTRGGVYSEGPMAAADSQEPLFRSMLRLIGMTDVHFVRAEGIALKGRDAVAAKAELDIEAILTTVRQPVSEILNG